MSNGGGIRGDRTYPADTVLTRKDILTELPFGNVTVLAEVTGADLLAALENGVSQVEDGAGRFPQVSGLSFTYDPTRPAGSRIVEVDGRRRARSTRREPTSSPPTTICSAAATAMPACGRPRRSSTPRPARCMASTLINYITALGGEVAPSGAGRIARRN